MFLVRVRQPFHQTREQEIELSYGEGLTSERSHVPFLMDEFDAPTTFARVEQRLLSATFAPTYPTGVLLPGCSSLSHVR